MADTLFKPIMHKVATRLIWDSGSGWLKESASQNIHLIVVTFDTFQLLSGWLKDVASLNIRLIFSTLDTFQLSSGWLKDSAPQNISDIYFT